MIWFQPMPCQCQPTKLHSSTGAWWSTGQRGLSNTLDLWMEPPAFGWASTGTTRNGGNTMGAWTDGAISRRRKFFLFFENRDISIAKLHTIQGQENLFFNNFFFRSIFKEPLLQFDAYKKNLNPQNSFVGLICARAFIGFWDRNFWCDPCEICGIWWGPWKPGVRDRARPERRWHQMGAGQDGQNPWDAKGRVQTTMHCVKVGKIMTKHNLKFIILKKL